MAQDAGTLVLTRSWAARKRNLKQDLIPAPSRILRRPTRAVP
jgi:hypothetical protein